MKRNGTKLTILFGVICALLAAASSWYTIVFNDSRFIAPMELSAYTFRVQDLPMIISGVLLALYILYLSVLLVRATIANKRKEADENRTRKLNPKLGVLGFLGFTGFLGIWTYQIDKTVFPFIFLVFFGFFGFFFEGKMSNVLMDERYRENQQKAQLQAYRTGFSITVMTLIASSWGWLFHSNDTRLLFMTISLSLAFGLTIFLSEYLLYRLTVMTTARNDYGRVYM